MNNIISNAQESLFNAISFIASILTIMGVILPIIKMILRRVLVKPQNWKDREAIRCSITNPINESENNDIMVILFLKDFVRMIIPIIILLVAVNICLFWINYDGSKDNMKGFLLILAEMNTCILCKLINAKQQSKIYSIVLVILDVILLDSFILEYVVGYGIRNGVEKMTVLMSIICVCSFVIIEGIIFVNRNNNAKRSKCGVSIRTAKVIWGLVYMTVLFYFTTKDTFVMYGNSASVLFFVVYTALCCIESKMNNNIKVEFKIYMKQNEDIEVTQKAIYQYEYNKVKYILVDGRTKIVDGDEIQFINYTIKNTIWSTIKNVIGKTKRKNVTCLLENNDLLNFDGYEFISDLWIRFYKLNKNESEVKVINSKRVKKIVME